MFYYRKASFKDLDKIWDKDILNNKDDDRYIRWKKEFIEANQKGNITTFVVLENDNPIGQISLIFNPENIKHEKRHYLCNNKEVANLATFRIEKEYEGQGHISKLVKIAEKYAKEKGIKKLTIGAEAKESRNLAIYLHFGFTEFITNLEEDGSLVLFYGKNI